MSKTTIKDIAQRVGVSKSLVSMYLNHHPLSAHIAQSTKEKIDRAVAETGYRPSITARAFKEGRSKTIGLVIGSITDIFFSYYASALLNEALRHDYQLLISLTRYNQEEEKRCLLNLMDRQTDGIIYHLHFCPDARYRKLVSGYPLLLTTSVDEFPSYNSFLPDLRTGLSEAFSAMSAEGCHRLVSFEMGEGFWNSVSREMSREHGIEYLSLQRVSEDDDEFYGKLLAMEPDFVLASSSLTALSYLRYCVRHSVKRMPRLVYSYTLPHDLLRHEAVYGALVNDFHGMIGGTMQRIIEMIEHPDTEVRNLHFPCRFMSYAELCSHYSRQVEELDFKNILLEHDKSL